MITCERQPTIQALVPTLAKRLGDRRATRAGLRRATRVDSQHHTTSFFRFVAQDLQEAAPCGVRYGLGQHAASHALDIQVFDKDHAVAIHQRASRLVVEVAACIANSRMRPLQQLHGFASAFRSTFAPGHTALSNPQFDLRLAVGARVIDHGSITEDGETRQPDINADVIVDRGIRRGDGLHTEADIPASGFALDGDGLDASGNRTMQLDFHFPNALNVELAVVSEPDAIAVARKRDAVVARTRLEAGIPWRLAPLDTPKERLEGLVHTAQDILRAREIGQATGIFSANVFELVRLVVVGQRYASLPVGIATLLQCGVVEATRLAQLSTESLLLIASRIQAIFKRLAHLPGFLLFDIPLDRGFRHRTHRADEIRPAPHRRHPAAKMRKFLSQDARGMTFNLMRQLRWAPGRTRLDEQVHVIRHHFTCVDFRTQLMRLLGDQFKQPSPDLFSQDRQPIFWAPHKVILQAEDRARIAFISCIFHAEEYTDMLYECQEDNRKMWQLRCQLLSPCQLKQAVPRRF